jgi:hypothetical protein
MTVDSRTIVPIDLAGEAVELLAERALFWPRPATLFIADPHFGKTDRARAPGGCAARWGRKPPSFSVLSDRAPGCDPARVRPIHRWAGNSPARGRPLALSPLVRN